MYQIDKKTADELIGRIKELSEAIITLIEKLVSNEKNSSVSYDPDEYLKRSLSEGRFYQSISPDDMKGEEDI